MGVAAAAAAAQQSVLGRVGSCQRQSGTRIPFLDV